MPEYLKRWIFVEAEAGRTVKAPQAGTARRANTLFVERVRVYKRRVTAGAEVLRFERHGRREAFGAHRNTGPSGQRALADTAIVGEEQRKKAVRDRSES